MPVTHGICGSLAIVRLVDQGNRKFSYSRQKPNRVLSKPHRLVYLSCLF